MTSAMIKLKNDNYIFYSFSFINNYGNIRYCSNKKYVSPDNEANGNTQQMVRKIIGTKIINPVSDQYGIMKKLITTKYLDAYNSYEKFLRFHEVKSAHDYVMVIQETLRKAQEHRRDVIQELNIVRRDLQAVHSDLLNTNRIDPKYLGLVKLEHELMCKEQQTLNAFNEADRSEREIFTDLTTAVKLSHEREKMYANTVRYWSIVGSIIGALLGIFATAINYHYRNEHVKLLTNEYTDKLGILDRTINGINTSVNQSKQEVIMKLMKVLDVLEKERNKKEQKTESWMDFFKRHASYPIRYIWPK